MTTTSKSLVLTFNQKAHLSSQVSTFLELRLLASGGWHASLKAPITLQKSELSMFAFTTYEVSECRGADLTLLMHPAKKKKTKKLGTHQALHANVTKMHDYRVREIFLSL